MAQAPLSDHTEELSNLSQALGLQYPVGTKQINKAALVLSYLMSRGIKGTIDLIEDNSNKSLYIDDFSHLHQHPSYNLHAAASMYLSLTNPYFL